MIVNKECLYDKPNENDGLRNQKRGKSDNGKMSEKEKGKRHEGENCDSC